MRRVVLFCCIWDRADTADGIIESYALTTLPPDPVFEKIFRPKTVHHGSEADSVRYLFTFSVST